MKRVTYLSAIVLASAMLGSSAISAQEESDSPISIGADLVSRYVWRGLDYGASPSIQPYVEAGFGGFTVGAWGAYTTSLSSANLLGIQEMDLYATYTFADLITVGVTDYFFPQEIDYNYNYFDYGSDTTGHVFEGMVSFNGLEDLPLTFMIGYNFLNDSDNSIYMELGYSFSIFDVFIGAGNGVYLTGDGSFSIVNLGLGASKEIKITDNFSLPVSASLITNPEAKQIHLVFGISL
jgi:hypothetical protein